MLTNEILKVLSNVGLLARASGPELTELVNSLQRFVLRDIRVDWASYHLWRRTLVEGRIKR